MSRIDANMSGYLHTYEAYRIPKGTKVKDAASKNMAKIRLRLCLFSVQWQNEVMNLGLGVTGAYINLFV